MSTRSQQKLVADARGEQRGARGFVGRDPADQIALVARAKRELLLRVHRHRLRREDLEDCYSQAVLELVAQVRRGTRFASSLHIANTLEQRFLSRISDQRRALSGRSPMRAALEMALSLEDTEWEGMELSDRRAHTESVALLREDLKAICSAVKRLNDDQQLALAAQVAEIDLRVLCARERWSAAKCRKVTQRARARLRELLADEACTDVPLADPLSERAHGTSMTTISSIDRRRSNGDPGGWLYGRSHAVSSPRASGRYPEISPLRVPAARVPSGERLD